MSGAGGQEPHGGTPDLAPFGLFIIWPKGRANAEPILDDLAERFRILRVVEVTWSDHLVHRNYERFYSDLEVAGVYHEREKGRGQFLAVAVWDEHPILGYRDTSRGPRMVSSNLVDAKHHYRSEMGNLCVHCGENEWESRRDLTMLLGLDLTHLTAIAPIDEAVPTASIHRDVTGATGWDSAAHLFSVLDPIVPYIAIGSGPKSKGDLLVPNPDPVQLLTPELYTLHTVLDGRAAFGYPRPTGGRFTVTVGGRPVPIDLRPVQGGLIDPDWAQSCVERRQLDADGVYRAPATDDIVLRSLIAVSRRRRLTGADQQTIGELTSTTAMAPASAVPARSGHQLETIDNRTAAAIVSSYLDEHGYQWVEPLDRTIVIHHPHHSPLDRFGRHVRATAATVAYHTTGHGRALYYRTRQLAAARLPRPRALWRWWRARS